MVAKLGVNRIMHHLALPQCHHAQPPVPHGEGGARFARNRFFPKLLVFPEIPSIIHAEVVDVIKKPCASFGGPPEGPRANPETDTSVHTRRP